MAFGKFDGRVVALWLDDGRKMGLREPFAYIASNGHRWDAPKGWTIDGASIPPIAWPIIGGPFEGKYRLASVVHDVACDVRDQPWQDVHLMFYEACRLAGEPERRAKVLYAAVYHFGPRWPKTPRSLRSEEDFVRMRQYIEDHPKMSLESIQTLTASKLRQAVPKPRESARRPERKK